MAQEQSRDKLSSFVVQTILTVDDFLMFKVCSPVFHCALTASALTICSGSAAGDDGEAQHRPYKPGKERLVLTSS